jgi:hypothetical protein
MGNTVTASEITHGQWLDIVKVRIRAVVNLADRQGPVLMQLYIGRALCLIFALSKVSSAPHTLPDARVIEAARATAESKVNGEQNIE